MEPSRLTICQPLSSECLSLCCVRTVLYCTILYCTVLPVCASCIRFYFMGSLRILASCRAFLASNYVCLFFVSLICLVFVFNTMLSLELYRWWCPSRSVLLGIVEAQSVNILRSV